MITLTMTSEDKSGQARARQAGFFKMGIPIFYDGFARADNFSEFYVLFVLCNCAIGISD